MKYNQLSKKMILILVSLSIVLSSVASANTKAEKQDREPTKQELQDMSRVVIYSLENVSNGTVIQDIQALDPAAGGALSYRLAAEVAVRNAAAVQLVKAIVMNQSMTQDEKKAMLRPLAVAVGTLYSTSMRHHYDDELNAHIKGENPIVKFFRLSAKEFFYTMRDIFTRTPKANIVSEAVVDDKGTKEKSDDVVLKKGQLSPEWNGANVDGERIWRMREKMIREVLGQDMTIEWQKAFKEIGDIKNEKADDAMRFMFYVDGAEQGNAEIAHDLRAARKGAHGSVYAAMAGLGFLYAVIPGDWFGLFFQARDYSTGSAEISVILSYSALAAFAILKKAGSAFTTLPIIKNLIEILKNPGSQTTTISEMKLPLLSKVLKIRQKIEKAKGGVACKLSLGTSSTSATMAKAAGE
jgi:hypothetical protein